MIHHDQGARRLASVEAAMRQAGMDLLVAPGRGVISHYGFLQFLSGYSPVIRMGAVIVQPGHPPTLVLTSASDCALAKDRSWIKDIRLASLEGPADASASLAALVRGRVSRIAAPRIGVAALDQAVSPRMLDSLKAAAPGGQIVDGSPLVQQVKAIKTTADIEGLRACAGMADNAVQALVESLADLATTLQAAAGAAAHSLYSNGAHEVLIYASKGPHYLHRPLPERLHAGDLLTVVIEASNADGYWTELMRLVTRGGLDPVQQGLVHDGQAIMDAAEDQLTPGQTGGQAYAALAAMIEARGYQSGLWLGHGVGVDEDLPIIGQGDQTPLAANMTIAFHPHLVDAVANRGASFGDTFLVTQGRAERLSRWPRDLIEV